MGKRTQRKKKTPKKKKQPIKKKQSDSILSEGNEEATHSGEALALKDVKTTKVHTHVWPFISGVIVALVGVFLAFWLTGWSEQRALDVATKQRLYHAGFEAKFNLGLIDEIKEDMDIDNKEDVNNVWVNVRRLGSAAAVVALQDANLLSILSGEKVILLGAYVNCLRTFNQCLQTYQQVLENQDFDNTCKVIRMRKLVLHNADGVRDMVDLLHEDLKECFDDKLYDPQKIENMQKRLNDIKAKYPKREEISAAKEG